MKRIVVVICSLVVLTSWALVAIPARVATASSGDAPLLIRGTGSWAPNDELTAWQDAMSGAPVPVNLEYTPGGTAAARQQFLNDRADFVISGVPFSAAELSGSHLSASDLIDVPIQATALTFLVQPPVPEGFESLSFTCDPDDPSVVDPNDCIVRTPYNGPYRVPSRNLAAMALRFGGGGASPLNAWNNPGLLGAWGVPALTVPPFNGPAPVLRSDADETNYYLQAFTKTAAPDVWSGIMAANPATTFEPITERLPLPTAPNRQGTEQQSLALTLPLLSPFSSGALAPVYPSTGQALAHGFPGTSLVTLQVQNGNGDWTEPTPDSIDAAVAAGGDSPLYAVTNHVPNAYPLTWIEHLYVRSTGLSPDKTNAIATLIRYLATAGQDVAATVGDGRLSPALSSSALAGADQLVQSRCVGSGLTIVQDDDPGPFAPPGTLTSIGPMLHCQGPTTPSGTPIIGPGWAPGAAVIGGGSGFATPELNQWRADTARRPYSLSVKYLSEGANFGRLQFASATSLDFGGSDIVYPPIEAAGLPGSTRCGGRVPQDCFVYVPISAGGLAVMYNLVDASGQRVNDLRLTRHAACGIFTGAITTWNDAEIVATNPQLAGFQHDIVPVIRSDGAGESYVFSQFCQAVAPDVWQAFVTRLRNDPNSGIDFKQGLPVSNWPQGWGHSLPVPLADGVANSVADPVTGPNAITVVAAGYAKARNDWPVASLENPAGQFTRPDENNVTLALGYATPSSDPAATGTFVLHFNGSDPRAYFPSTYSYVLAQTTGLDSRKGATLAQFLCYSVSAGQANAKPLGYAALTGNVVQTALDRIALIPGAPPRDQCDVEALFAPPPELGEFPQAAVALAVGVLPLAAFARRRRRKLRRGEAACNPS